MSQNAEGITQTAKGGFEPDLITQTESLSTPIISHLSENEQLQYVFYHTYKGFRIFYPDGNEETPDHDMASWGKRFLVISDQRIIYIVGKESGDEIQTFDYDDIVEVDANRGWTHGRINISTKDETEYKFADGGSLASDIEAAGEYVRERIKNHDNISTVQENNDNTNNGEELNDKKSLSTEEQVVEADIIDGVINNTGTPMEEIGVTAAERDSSTFESNAQGDVDGTELTSTGGKIFKVGYFESTVASRLNESETVEYVLRNFTDGVEYLGEDYKPEDNRRAIACITNQRLLFVIGGQYTDSDGNQKDRAIIIPHDRILQATDKGGKLVVTAISDDEGAVTSRFPVKNTNALSDAVNYLHTRRSESVLDQRVQEIETAVDKAEALFKDEQYSDAIDAAEQAIENYDEYEKIINETQTGSESESHSGNHPVQSKNIPAPEDSKNDIKKFINRIKSSKRKRSYESHRQRAEELQKEAENKDPLEVDLSSYSTAIEELEQARKIATQHEVGNPDEIRKHVDQINRQRYEAQQAKIKQLQKIAEKKRDSDDLSDTIEVYSQILDELMMMREIASKHDKGDTDAVVDELEEVKEKKDELQIVSLGQQVSNVAIPELTDISGDVTDIEEKIDNLKTLLKKINDMNTNREDDLDLIRKETQNKLGLCKFRKQKSRALIATERFHDGEYTESRRTFESVAEQLQSLDNKITDAELEEQSSDIERLAETCKKNADIARRTALGLADDTELQTVDPKITEQEDSDEGNIPENIPQMSSITGSEQGISASEPSSFDAGLSYEDLDKQKLIGSGGNADVYRAITSVDQIDSVVAVKEPRMEGTIHTEAVERFISEAETWSQLDDNDHIVSVLGHGPSPIPWIALEYMEDGDLNTQRAKLDLNTKFRVAIQITDAVWGAHQRGVAHLDLKPENILFTSSDDEASRHTVPKVADWGLAKMLLNHSKSVEGLSPEYSAPEQFDSDTYGNPDNQTDIYQMGVILYELFTNQHPFQGRPSQVMHSVLYDMPDPPSTYAPDLPEGLDPVILTALEKQKSDRYETMVYLRDMLQKTATFESP